MSTRRPSIAIFGNYRTGTTALFHRVRGGLPPDARALFEPSVFEPLPTDTRTGVLAKVIVRPRDGRDTPVDLAGFLRFDRRVAIVRDPRDWLISALLFAPQERLDLPLGPELEAILELLRAKEADPGAVGFDRLWHGLIGTRLDDVPYDHLEAIVAFLPRLGENAAVVRYEEMIAGQLAQLERYLGLQLDGRPELPAAQAHVPRTRRSGNWRQWLTPADVELLRPRLDPYLSSLGYDCGDWRLASAPAIPPEHGSGYVERTVALSAARRARGAGAGDDERRSATDRQPVGAPRQTRLGPLWAWIGRLLRR